MIDDVLKSIQDKLVSIAGDIPVFHKSAGQKNFSYPFIVWTEGSVETIPFMGDNVNVDFVFPITVAILMAKDKGDAALLEVSERIRKNMKWNHLANVDNAGGVSSCGTSVSPIQYGDYSEMQIVQSYTIQGTLFDDQVSSTGV